jgi:hypothetical protein
VTWSTSSPYWPSSCHETDPNPPSHHTGSHPTLISGLLSAPVQHTSACLSLSLWVDRQRLPRGGYCPPSVARSLQWHPCGFGGLKEETPQGACRMSVSGVLAGLFFMRSSDTTHKKKIGYTASSRQPHDTVACWRSQTKRAGVYPRQPFSNPQPLLNYGDARGRNPDAFGIYTDLLVKGKSFLLLCLTEQQRWIVTIAPLFCQLHLRCLA